MKQRSQPSPGLFSKSANRPNCRAEGACKQTDFGLIPTDWDPLPLRSLGRFLSGGTPPLKDPSLWGGDIPWVSSKDMKTHRLHDSIDHVTELATMRGTRLVEPGAILIVVRGMALLHTLPVALVEQPLTFNQDLKAFVPAPDVNPEFILGWLQASESRLLSLATEATHGTKRLPVPDLMAAQIGVPSRKEQDAIAEALADVDWLIASLEKLIAKKRAIKRAAMQQLLTGKTRLPGFTGKWDPTTIGEVAEIKNGATPSTRITAFWNGAIPWCTPTDITGTPGKYLSLTERSITEAGLAACAANLLPPGTLLLCSRATIGEVKIATTHVCTNQGFKSLVCRPGTSNEFMYYLVLTLKSEMVERAIGSTFLEIGKRDLSAIPLRMPRENEQLAIATVLCDMDTEIEALEHRREKARQIKQGMMQQLLTGRIRLVTLEAQAPAGQADSNGKASKPHSWAFNEAVVISALAERFGSEQYPLGRKRYTKLSYLLHRRVDGQTEGYLKKAAGPYNPKTKYGGPERIATENGYIRPHKGPKGHSGFIAGENIAQAQGYFEKWYGPAALQWLDQFRFRKNDELELLATVDMAAEELRQAGQDVDAQAVKTVIRNHPEWKAKLDRPIFSDERIAEAIDVTREMFGEGDQNYSDRKA